ncbi:MAG TPA: PhnA protein [Fusobacteriaceae bacterium]|nr:PhnA protein [Fusobacteriaceae bacterium]
MAKWKGISKARKNNVPEFGKGLVRRSKSTCELCGESNRSLSVYEVGKTDEEADLKRCVHICDECKNTIKNLDPATEYDLRFLNNAIWSEEIAVKATAIHIISELENKDRYPWIEDLLDMIYIDDELKEICEKMKH